MSIHIHKERCVGCGKCTKVCPGNLLKQDEHNKAFIICPEDCWGCTACIKECNVKAISYFLGADIGGNGSVMHTEEEGDLLHWIIEDSNNNQEIITINKKQANAY